jgi:hypothetical protein
MCRKESGDHRNGRRFSVCFLWAGGDYFSAQLPPTLYGALVVRKTGGNDFFCFF